MGIFSPGFYPHLFSKKSSGLKILFKTWINGAHNRPTQSPKKGRNLSNSPPATTVAFYAQAPAFPSICLQVEIRLGTVASTDLPAEKHIRRISPEGVEQHRVCLRQLHIIAPMRNNLIHGSDLNTMVTSTERPTMATTPQASTTGGTFFVKRPRRHFFFPALSSRPLFPFFCSIVAFFLSIRDKKIPFRRHRWRAVKPYISTGLTGHLQFS